MRTLSRVLICVALASTSASAGEPILDNQGREFLLSFLPNTIDGAIPIAELHLTAGVATNVDIEYPANAPTTTLTVSLTPGDITIVSLPASASSSWVADAVDNNVVRATSDDEFVCYMINRVPFTSDAGLGLPVDTFNTDYIAIDYDPRFGPSQFVVTAAFDGTEVTITPSVALQGGHAAGVPYVVELDAGEGYYGASVVTVGPLGSVTGTVISSNLSVGLTNGSECVQVPLGTTYCDHVFEVAQPLQTWGERVLVANLPNRPSGSIYRVVSGADDTTITLDGAFLATLDMAGFVEVGPIAGDHVFEADDAIFVTQYMTGNDAPGAVLGDPAQGNMVPTEQYLEAYTFSTIGGGQFVQNYVTIIADDLDVGALLLDGAPVAGGAFSAIGGTGYSVARIAIAGGTHTTSSIRGHGLTVEGYNDDDSYLFPGGARFKFINAVGDDNPPVCQLSVDAATMTASGTATDDLPSEDVNGNQVLDDGEDLNDNGQIDVDTGVFFVELAPGSNNLVLAVASFTPGDPSVDFALSLADGNQSGSGVVVVTDGAGNEASCPVTINQPISLVDNGCAGGAPGGAVLQASGTLQPNSPVELVLSDAAPLSVAVLMAGIEQADLSRKGCSLMFVPAVTLPLMTDGAGSLDVPFRWPVGLPVGFEIYAQFYILDGLAPAGFSTSNTVLFTSP